MTFEPAEGGCTVRFEHGGWTAQNVDQRGKFREWPLLLRRFAALAGPDDRPVSAVAPSP